MGCSKYNDRSWQNYSDNWRFQCLFEEKPNKYHNISIIWLWIFSVTTWSYSHLGWPDRPCVLEGSFRKLEHSHIGEVQPLLHWPWCLPVNCDKDSATWEQTEEKKIAVAIQCKVLHRYVNFNTLSQIKWKRFASKFWPI